MAVTRLARILRRETHTGLTPTQVAALATLQRQGPVPVGMLADAEQISAPTATKVIDKLARAGLVERRTDPGDRRVSLVAVTASGHDLLATTRQHKTAWLSMRIAALDPADRARLLDAIEVLEHLVAPHAPGAAGDQSPPPDREARP
ncbi:MAG TPA: MarR family transcriptional regulator [Acidimicrobiales bacterium]|nr:MarR family transcriptional regulator [Acidimicrobiales bacterium]